MPRLYTHPAWHSTGRAVREKAGGREHVSAPGRMSRRADYRVHRRSPSPLWFCDHTQTAQLARLFTGCGLGRSQAHHARTRGEQPVLRSAAACPHAPSVRRAGGVQFTGSVAAFRRGRGPECEQAGAGEAPRGACPSAHEVVRRAGDGRVLPSRYPQLPYHYDFERVVEIVHTNVTGGATITRNAPTKKAPFAMLPCCQGRRGLRGTTLIDGRLNAEWT